MVDEIAMKPWREYGDKAWPPPAERVLPFLHGLVGPSRWSVAEQSRVVEIPCRQDDLGGL